MIYINCKWKLGKSTIVISSCKHKEKYAEIQGKKRIKVKK
jgi:hypothetical protein